MPPREGNNGGAPRPVEESFDINELLGALYGVETNFDFTITGKEKTITKGNGQEIEIFPGYRATFTSEDGDTFTIIASGPYHKTYTEDTIIWTSTGRSLQLDPEAGFVAVAGRFTWVTDLDGQLIEPLSGVGRVTDVGDILGLV